MCLISCVLSCLQVLFDDVGQSLIRLSSPDLQFQLIEAFLQFLGVPSGFLPPASCLYLAMDESSIFESKLYDEKPLTYFNPLFSGISCVGYMEQLDCPRWTKGHNREGEEFVRNVFHLVLPLFSGKQKCQLCLSWLRYEIAKVTAAAPLTAHSPQCTCVPLSSNFLLQTVTSDVEERQAGRRQSRAWWPELSVVSIIRALRGSISLSRVRGSRDS